MWEALNELNGIGKVGATVILAALVSCILACAYVVYDTALDAHRTIRDLRKNKKTKN